MSADVIEAIFSTPVYGSPSQVNAPGAHLLVLQHATLVPNTPSVGERFGLGDGDPRFDEGLRARLAELAVGTGLRVLGDETFLWRVHGLACEAGLLDEEIELIRIGTRRRLYCVHCATLQDIGEVGEATCQGCGVRLLVRNHFSRRLGAYAGVCLDPDAPTGEGRA